MDHEDLDQRVRLAAFRFLEEETGRRGEVLPHGLLREGFVFEGRRVPLVGAQGIFKPAVLPEMPLTILTAPPREGEPPPYEDSLGADGLLRYRYRGTDPGHRDNVGLRRAMQRDAPLIYLFGVVKGEYLAIWPVYVVGEEPAQLAFTVAVDDRRFAGPGVDALAEPMRRTYVTRVTLRRLHQESFRARVLQAYQERCAMCRLRRAELLDAAHILPDSHPRGEPIVPNGLALCKLHHAAFDRHILGVRPDLVVEVRRDVLTQGDGPMLEHGLKQMHGKRLLTPRRPELRPYREFLEERYELFRAAS